MLPTTAFAAWAVPTLTVEAVRDGDQIKTTVKIGPHTDMGAINFTLNYDSSKLTLSGNPTGQNFLSGAIIGSVTPGKITPTWHDINATSSATEIPILTATFDIVAGQSGPAVFTIDSISITDKSGDEENTSPGTGSVTTTTVTIPKSPITSVTASVDAPVKGQPLDTTVDIGAATGYTGTVKWYVGETEATETNAKANTEYTAKITLTASSGESFAEGVTLPTGYTKVSADATTIVLTKDFPATTRAVVTKVQIASTPPSLNVPEALGIDKPGTVTATNTYSVTVFMDGSPVVNPSGVVWSISDLDGVTVDPATGDMTISSDCPGGGITLTATYGGVSSTPANLTVWRATSAAKWLKIVDPATGGEPQTTIMRPVGTALTDWIQVEYKAKVYDQFSQPVNITDIEWTTNPSAIKIGTTDLVDEGIRQIRVSHNTEAIPFDLTAALKTDPTIKGTVTIKVEEKTLETLTVTQADTTYGTALSDPVFTKPEGTIKTLVHYSTPTSGGYSSDTPPTNAGEYVVNVVCETATHIYTGHANFKIEPKSISNMLQPITGTYTYTGAPQKPTAVVMDGTKPLVEGTDYTVSYGTNVHVFEAATVYVEGKGNYTGTFSRNFNIQPKPIDIEDVNTTNRDYEKDNVNVDCTVKLPVASDVKQGEHYLVFATMDDDTAGSNKTVNVLVKMVKGGLGENYTLNKDTTTATVNINKINPADPTGLKGVKGQKLFTVELPAGWTWYAPSEVMDTAGAQTFLVNYAGDANHNALHMHLITVNVLDKTDVSAFITFPDGEKEYTGSWMEYKEATISGTNLGTGAKWNYVYTAGTGTLMAAGFPEGIGTYTVTATYEDSINFGIATATLTIVPKKVAIPAADTTVFTYDGNAKTYGIADTADYTVTGNSQTNAGDHTVTVALKDKATTTWTDGTTADKTYTFTIKQATPTGEPAYTKITTSGKKLSDAALTTTGGTLSVPGTVKWVDDTTGADLPDTTTVEANKLYKWVFTPTDSTNYESINGTIKLWSKSTSSGGGSYYAPVVPDMPMLYRGCTGDAVKTLQDKLNALGYNSGNVDGIFGAKTYAAVTAFQKANSLGV
ncbi:MAG: peptidoglycan-binding protein, partial [Vescimonas sp.]|uniref:peptidoglycan-binding protein n=1 Tax=Vescimonas sp. TaxID=2892404 RepID=UPI002A918D5A